MVSTPLSLAPASMSSNGNGNGPSPSQGASPSLLPLLPAESFGHKSTTAPVTLPPPQLCSPVLPLCGLQSPANGSLPPFSFRCHRKV